MNGKSGILVEISAVSCAKERALGSHRILPYRTEEIELDAMVVVEEAALLKFEVLRMVVRYEVTPAKAK